MRPQCFIQYRFWMNYYVSNLLSFPFLKTGPWVTPQSLALSSTQLCSVPQTHLFASPSTASLHVKLEVFTHSGSSSYSVLTVIVLNWAFVIFWRWGTRIPVHLGGWLELAKGETCVRFGRQNEAAVILFRKGVFFTARTVMEGCREAQWVGFLTLLPAPHPVIS